MSMDEAELTLKVREAARDADALSWGSRDVSREDVLARVHGLRPEESEQLDRVLTELLQASRRRQREYERLGEILKRLRDQLEDIVES